MINVLVKNPGEPAEMRQVEPGLEAGQSIVGGCIELVSGTALGLPDEIDMYCNEEGIFLGLEPNLDIGHSYVLGPIYFTAGDDEGNNVGLKPEHCDAIKAWMAGKEL